MLSKPPAASRHFLSSASLIVIPRIDGFRVTLLIEVISLTEFAGKTSGVKAGGITSCLCIVSDRVLLRGTLKEGTLQSHQLLEKTDNLRFFQ